MHLDSYSHRLNLCAAALAAALSKVGNITATPSDLLGNDKLLRDLLSAHVLLDVPLSLPQAPATVTVKTLMSSNRVTLTTVGDQIEMRVGDAAEEMPRYVLQAVDKCDIRVRCSRLT